MNTRIIIIAIACTMLTACATTSVDIAGTTVVTGTVQALAGMEGCYILEAGKKINEKAFYQLNGDEALIRSCLTGPVTVRLRIDSTGTGRCPVGTPALLVDILER